MEHTLELRKLIIRSINELGLAIEESHAEQFLRYIAHLIKWNETINLTAIIEPYEIIIKHFADSLTALVATSFQENTSVLDVGSGGGFPGIPLKIVRPDIQLVLVEPVLKKCSFLTSIVGLLKLHNVSIFNGTIQRYAEWPLRNRSTNVVTVRALKYREVKKHIPAVLVSKGKVILYRTEAINADEIGEDFHLINETTFTLPQGSGRRVITVIEKN